MNRKCLLCEETLIRKEKEAPVLFTKRKFCNNSHARKWEFINIPHLQRLRQEGLRRISEARSAALWKDGKKICSKCRKYFPPTNEYFSPQKEMTRKWSSWCKKCKREQMSEKGLHLIRASEGSWTAKEKQQAFINQKGKCAICGKILISWKKAHADHIHGSSMKRALLCQHCNHLLGSAFDNIEILQKAITYLQRNYSSLTSIS